MMLDYFRRLWLKKFGHALLLGVAMLFLLAETLVAKCFHQIKEINFSVEWLRQRNDSSAYANRKTMIRFYNLFLHIRTLSVPTIAAINGPAIGAGMCMTLGCDFRITSKSARIGFTFVKLG